MSEIMDELRRRNAVINLQGKSFVTYTGLLALAHVEGIESIDTDMLHFADGVAVFKATAKGKRGTFTGHGDASKENVKRGMTGAILRMAETRAICRALRCYLGCGMTAREELPGSSYVDAEEVRALPTSPSRKVIAPKWTAAERKEFLVALDAKGIAPKQLMSWASREGKPNPAEWTSEQRTAFLNNPPESLK